MDAMNTNLANALAERFDAVLLDVGGTLVAEAAPGTPVDDLRVEPLPGVCDTLRSLVGMVRLAAVTNTSAMRADDVRGLLAAVGLADCVEVIITSVDVGAAKPDPAPLRAALAQLGVAAEHALFVGDRASDRDAARSAGVRFVGTDRGLADALSRATRRSTGAFAHAAAQVLPLDGSSVLHAQERHARLTKPAGSLGRLETLGAQLAGIARSCPPPIPVRPAIAVFAADHGVVASGVTPWPQEVTMQMVRNFVAGGTAINAIARQCRATLRVIDVGVATDLQDLAGVDHRNIRPGTDDLSYGPAMTCDDAYDALDVGAEVAQDLIGRGHDLLVTGEMGIGNTTPSAAIIGALTLRTASTVTGRGTGIDETMLTRKTAIVDHAIARVAPFLDPISILSEIGGLEIAALAGFIAQSAAFAVPVVTDGVITLAALLIADALVPSIACRCIAGHQSTEPGAVIALAHLGLDPVLTLDLRLGEGTGGCLAIPIVQAAARVLHEMATFDDAAIPDETRGADAI
jgi:nicotinate-nucleotide--dimethylbenzimidazole phosphoribosyltransferase